MLGKQASIACQGDNLSLSLRAGCQQVHYQLDPLNHHSRNRRLPSALALLRLHTHPGPLTSCRATAPLGSGRSSPPFVSPAAVAGPAHGSPRQHSDLSRVSARNRTEEVTHSPKILGLTNSPVCIYSPSAMLRRVLSPDGYGMDLCVCRALPRLPVYPASAAADCLRMGTIQQADGKHPSMGRAPHLERPTASRKTASRTCCEAFGLHRPGLGLCILHRSAEQAGATASTELHGVENTGSAAPAHLHGNRQ